MVEAMSCGEVPPVQLSLQFFAKVLLGLYTWGKRFNTMKCHKCGAIIDLNASLRRLKNNHKKNAREGNHLTPPPGLWPLHLRIKLGREKLPRFFVEFANHAGRPLEDILGPSRERSLVIPRHALMWFLSENSHMTLSEIGRIFNRHHATVLHARENTKRLLSVADKLTAYHVELCELIAPQVWPQINEQKAGDGSPAGTPH